MEDCLYDWCINNEYEILLKEWHPIRNGTLTAKDFAPKSNKYSRILSQSAFAPADLDIFEPTGIKKIS